MTKITTDRIDKKLLQLNTHTHEVQAKSTCMFGAYDKRLACLGVKEYYGEKCRMIVERFAGERFSLRGAE